MLKPTLLAAALLAAASLPAFAATENYTIDPTHTFPSLEFDHMGLSMWRGKFDKTSGTITLDRAANTGTADIVVEMASINFGLGAMDEKARSEDFFDTAKHPKGTYKGTIRFVDGKPKTVDGTITLLGVSKPLQLSVKRFNCIVHPFLKQDVCGADVEGEVNWGEFGMKMSQYAQGDAGRVKLQISVEAFKQPAAK